MKFSIKGLKVPIKKSGELSDLIYEAADETAGLIKPVRLRSAYREKYSKDISQAKVMKMMNTEIKREERQGTPSILKHEDPNSGTIYLDKGTFVEWLDKGFLNDFIAFFEGELLKTRGAKPYVEKYKLEDFLVRYNIPRGLATEIILDALCTEGKLNRHEDMYAMPRLRDLRKDMVIKGHIRSTLRDKGYMVEDELMDVVVKKANDEFAKTEMPGSEFSGLNVSVIYAREVLDKMLGSRYKAFSHEIGNTEVRMIVDVVALDKIIGGMEPSIIEGLKDKFKDKMGRKESLTKEDIIEVVDTIVQKR